MYTFQDPGDSEGQGSQLQDLGTGLGKAAATARFKKMVGNTIGKWCCNGGFMGFMGFIHQCKSADSWFSGFYDHKAIGKPSKKNVVSWDFMVVLCWFYGGFMGFTLW